MESQISVELLVNDEVDDRIQVNGTFVLVTKEASCKLQEILKNGSLSNEH